MYDLKKANKKTAEESTQLIVSVILTFIASKITTKCGYVITPDILFAILVIIKITIHRVINMWKNTGARIDKRLDEAKAKLEKVKAKEIVDIVVDEGKKLIEG